MCQQGGVVSTEATPPLCFPGSEASRGLALALGRLLPFPKTEGSAGDLYRSRVVARRPAGPAPYRPGACCCIAWVTVAALMLQ